MSRTLTILYDSRAEAELARERLAGDLKAQSIRIIAKDTLAAIEGLKINKKEAFALRQALRRGDHVVTAEVASGTTPDHIIGLLGLSPTGARATPEQVATAPFRYGIEKGHEHVLPADRVPEKAAPISTKEPSLQAAPEFAAEDKSSEYRAHRERASEATLQNGATPGVRGAMHSSMTEAEAEAAGLFKERTIDFAEMREEAIVTKEAVVREEVIVTKTVKERTETIRDTVRHTEFEVQQLEPATSSRSERPFEGRRS